jgi:hypothetical protein
MACVLILAIAKEFHDVFEILWQFSRDMAKNQGFETPLWRQQSIQAAVPNRDPDARLSLRCAAEHRGNRSIN